MATRNNHSNHVVRLSKNEEIALELAKAAVQGGALQRLKAVESVGTRAQHDAIYSIGLYKSILKRLENAEPES
ncbi:hypothetical protein KOE80_02370 [Alcaligenes sp. 13f]|jgi:TPP-dependent indolepyruvate ferredoxin oxidoreductase alpha subunit|uniref:hypothetical protein n=1 Tax=Alcaligenes sp. 13f TaxID=2841924 RepID=UPI001CF6C6A9|nr:hypothetical protein [Alcaligenes sp. 13f]MCB4321049.1 hypothetical protein [Alcaligenes sp. 13f]